MAGNDLRRKLRDRTALLMGIVTPLVIGFVLAFVVYLVFSKLLALGLPVGPLERLM